MPDSLGNVVSPRGTAKVSPAHRTEAIKAGGTYVYEFDRMWFTTGTARFGYTLNRTQDYKVIAVYRPAGPDGPGFTSNEVLLGANP